MISLQVPEEEEGLSGLVLTGRLALSRIFVMTLCGSSTESLTPLGLNLPSPSLQAPGLGGRGEMEREEETEGLLCRGSR